MTVHVEMRGCGPLQGQRVQVAGTRLRVPRPRPRGQGMGLGGRVDSAEVSIQARDGVGAQASSTTEPRAGPSRSLDRLSPPHPRGAEVVAGKGGRTNFTSHVVNMGGWQCFGRATCSSVPLRRRLLAALRPPRVDVAMLAERATRMLDHAIGQDGKPRRIRTNNGPEFTARFWTPGPTPASSIISSDRASRWRTPPPRASTAASRRVPESAPLPERSARLRPQRRVARGRQPGSTATPGGLSLRHCEMRGPRGHGCRPQLTYSTTLRQPAAALSRTTGPNSGLPADCVTQGALSQWSSSPR